MFPMSHPFAGSAGLSRTVKKNTSLVSSLSPTVWIVRGLTPNPSVLRGLFEMTKSFPLAKLPEHPYFSDEPSPNKSLVVTWQPGPQHHLQEEIHNLWRVMKGAECKIQDLDCTATLVKVPNTKDVVVYHPVPLTESSLKELDPVLSANSVSALIFPSRNSSLKGLTDWANLCSEAPIYATESSIEALHSMFGENGKRPVRPLREIGSLDLGQDIRLIPIIGDPTAQEYVLYAHNTLSTVESYYGAYTDMDPCSTWVCRAWFKFTRSGDYKSEMILPSYRRSAVVKNGSVEDVRRSLRALCDGLDFDTLIFSNGTPPCVKQAKEKLLRQWEW